MESSEANMAVDRSQQFLDKMNDLVLSSFTCLSIGLGQDLGLFDVLAAHQRPLTSTELAQEAGCKER